MKKRGNNSKKRKKNFVKGANELLNSIEESKKELMLLKNQELRNLTIKEREGIKLIKEKIKKQKLGVLERYEKGKENLGKILLTRKKQELGTHLSIEKKSLNRTNKEIGKIGKNLKKIRK